MKNLVLSVIIPTYNSSDYLENTIRAVIECLRMKKIFFELIIVNDSSSDNTSEICKKLCNHYGEVKLIELKDNCGQRIATSIGYTNAKGVYVVTFDDDLQFNPEDIYNLLIDICKSNQLIISGYYSFKEKQFFYNIIKKTIFFSINYIFFPKYKSAKYFTPFKIFDKKNLCLLNIKNIYYFWKVKNELIGTLKIEKRKSIRANRNYSFKQFYRLLAPLIYKILSKVTLFSIMILIAMLFYFKTVFFLFGVIISFLGYLLLIFLLKKEEVFH